MDHGTRPETVQQLAFVRGDVQGVGFRWWVRSQALELGVRGYASNLPDGRVQVLAVGSSDAVGELVGRLDGDVPGRPGRVTGVVAHDPVPAPADVPDGFLER